MKPYYKSNNSIVIILQKPHAFVITKLQLIPLYFWESQKRGESWDLVRRSLTIIASAGWFGLVWYVGRGFCIGLFFPSLSRDQHWLCNTSPHRGASLLLPPPPIPPWPGFPPHGNTHPQPKPPVNQSLLIWSSPWDLCFPADSDGR